MYFLGMDFGTTSLKAAIYDEHGVLLNSASTDYTLKTAGNHVEFDAEEYLSIFMDCLIRVKSDLPVTAMAIDTQCETLIFADENGAPLCDAIVWLDNRADAEANEIKEAFGRELVYNITGQPDISATWPACKLLWMKRNRPEIMKKVKKIFLLEDFLLFRLTGAFVTERTLQSSSLYFNIHTGDWWDDMLEYIGIDRSMLPALHGSGEAIGEYSGMTVVTGAMDQVAGAIGAGVVKTGMISEMTGTAMTLFVPLDTPPSFNIESAIPCHYNFDGSYALVLWTPVAGMALKWFRDQLCEGTSYDELGKMAELIKPGSESLLFLPYLCGSTVPTWNPDARGVFYGLSLGHTRGHFVRAILESVAYLLKSSLEYLGLDAYEIRSMGGAAKSDIWSQIKANVTQKRIVTLQNTETASLGAAMLAATGVGAFASVAEASFAQASKVYLPDGTDYTPDYERFVLLSNILDRKGGI